MAEKNCDICGGELEESTSTVVKVLGIKNLIRVSQEIEDGKHTKWLDAREVIIHQKCHVAYINSFNINAAKRRKISENDFTSFESTNFNFKQFCVVCGLSCDKKLESKKPKARRRTICTILPNSSTTQNLLEKCKMDDEESRNVLARIANVEDLASVEAKYHTDCYNNFVRKVERSVVQTPPRSKYSAEFENLFHFIEHSEDCQWSFNDLLQVMGDPRPSSYVIKHRLEEKYGDNIIFTDRGPLNKIVTFKGLSDNILKKFFNTHLPAESDADRKSEVLKLASQYIREDIRASNQELHSYPSATDFFSDDWIKDVIPESLTLMLNEIILPHKKNEAASKRKIIAIAHAIMSATRPNTFISSLLLSLSLYIHSNHASKILINILNRLGFCASYDEALLYEGSTVMTDVPTVQPTRDSFLQFIHDNADYDVNTLDGKNTFHYTGAAMVITPASSVTLNSNIKRLNPPPKASDIAAKYKVVELIYTKPETRGLSEIVIEDIRKLRPLQSNKSFLLPGEVLWVTGHWLKFPKYPGWNGFMELRSNSSLYEKSKIKFLPFIYLKATDNSALYTAIIFGIREAKKYDQENFFFTFDQQLYIKAREILADVQSNRVQSIENMDKVFIRLGGFHLIMSFLGCIGKVMDGSGLQEAWGTIYAEKSTEKMLSGKNYARSMRANYYTETALLIMILNKCDFTDSEKLQLQAAIMREPIKGEIKKSVGDKTLLEDLETNPITSVATEKIIATMNDFRNRGKTASLWIQYIKMVSLVRSFIQAERSGDFDLHLSTIIEMLPFFHSCRHFNYAKSAHLYVQDMLQLEKKMDNPLEFDKYTKSGYFTIRRTDKFFCGVSADMVMEQTLMCTIHSVPGFCHGRGFSESVITSWLNTQTFAAYINGDLQDYCGVKSVYSEQNKDFRDSTIVRDLEDLTTLLNWFENHPPFPTTDKIMSIATGITGGPDVNCFNAERLGIKSLNSILPKETATDGAITTTNFNYLNVKFDSDLQVIPLSTSNGSITIGKTKYAVDAKVIFNRFARSKPDENDFPAFFEYELSPFPTSIFDSQFKLRHGEDDSFAIFDSIDCSELTNKFYIIDGETLLFQIPWPKVGTYQDVYNKYCQYITENYGTECVVIFSDEESEFLNPVLSKVWYSSSVTHQQFDDLTPYLSVIRAITGCKTTSAFFGIKIKTAIKTLLKDRQIEKMLKVFTSPCDMSDIVNTGGQLIMTLYRKTKSSKSVNLNQLRCERYKQSLKISRKTDFNLASLPPTNAAAEHHILRTYWQVQRWNNITLPVTSYGWHIVNNLLVPTTTVLPPVPEKLIGLITCACKKICKPKTCSCMKSGLLCSNLCKHCTDITCSNKGIENTFFENPDIPEDTQTDD